MDFVLAARASSAAPSPWRGCGPAPHRCSLFGLAALFGYPVVQTLQPESRYGRVFAAYAGVFLMGALSCGLAGGRRGPRPVRRHGAGMVLVGIMVILFGGGSA